MAQLKLSIEFRGLCAFVCNGPNDAQTKNVDVLLVAAEETDYSDDIHKPALVFPLENFRGESEDGSYTPFATPDGEQWGFWSLKDRIVQIRLGKIGSSEPDEPLKDKLNVSNLTWLPDLERAARTAVAGSDGAGVVDQVCVSDNPSSKPVSSRIRLGGGDLTCNKQVKKDWSFHPALPGKCYNNKSVPFANVVSFTLESQKHDLVVLEAIQFGTASIRTLTLQPRSGIVGVSMTNFSSSSVASDHRPHSLAYYDLAGKVLPADNRPRPYQSSDCTPEVPLGPGEIGCSPFRMYAPGVEPDASGW